MSDGVIETSVWDLLLARVLVDPTLVLLSEMDANILSEWVRLSPDKFCVGLPSSNAIMLSSSPFSTRTSVVLCLDFCTAREE
jgi:hypothetical protein